MSGGRSPQICDALSQMNMRCTSPSTGIQVADGKQALMEIESLSGHRFIPGNADEEADHEDHLQKSGARLRAGRNRGSGRSGCGNAC
jgi:hypothetical protein